MKTTSKALLLALGIVSGCAAPPEDPCTAAANEWTTCTGAVPNGFMAACEANPDLGTQLTTMSCNDLTTLNDESKADGGPFTGWDSTAVKPDNFAQVSANVFRGQHLMTNSKIRYLENLNIKTVIDLEIDNPEEFWEEALLKVSSLTDIRKPMHWNSTYPADFIDDILATVNDSNNWPVYVHCYYGYDRTGLIIALYQIVSQDVAPIDAFHDWKAHMPGTNRCASFPDLNGMFNRKVSELYAATGDERYQFQIDTANCAAQ